MQKKYFLSFLLFFTILFRHNLVGTSFAQNRNIDSLLFILKNDKSACQKPCLNDTSKVIHLIALCNEYRNIGDYESGLKFGNEALQIATNIQAQKCIATACNNLGNINYSNGNYFEALKNYSASLQVNKILKNKKDIAGSYLNIGIIYYYQNNYPEALKNYYASLNLREEIGDKEGIANSYTNIGLVYDDPDHYPDALKYYFDALKIYENIENNKGIADSYNNIGRIYNSMGNYSEALKMYFASLKINEDVGDKYGIAFSYTNIGNIYWNQVNYPKINSKVESSSPENILKSAFQNYFEALKVRKEIGEEQGIIEAFINLGNVQMDLKKLKEAEDYLNKALQLSKKINNKEWIKESYSRLEELDSIQGNWKAAYQYYKLFILYRDSIEQQESENKLAQDLVAYESEKKEGDSIVEQDKKNMLEDANKKNQQFILIIFSVIFILMIVLAGFFFRSKRALKKN